MEACCWDVRLQELCHCRRIEEVDTAAHSVIDHCMPPISHRVSIACQFHDSSECNALVASPVLTDYLGD